VNDSQGKTLRFECNYSTANDEEVEEEGGGGCDGARHTDIQGGIISNSRSNNKANVGTRGARQRLREEIVVENYDNRGEDHDDEEEDCDDREDQGRRELHISTVHILKKSSRPPPTSVEEACRQLAAKIESSWAKAKTDVKAKSAQWNTSPLSFFGCEDLLSGEQWSYTCAVDTEEKRYQFRQPFHKKYLADCLEKRTLASNAGNQELRSRKRMLQELEPGLTTFSRGERRARYTMFQRLINHGKILQAMARWNAGLLITMAPHLTFSEYVLLFLVLFMGR